MDDEELAEAVVESITYHFAVGNSTLDSAQFGQHLEFAVCPACDCDINAEALLGLELAAS